MGKELRDKVYKLRKGAAPLVYFIPSSSTPRVPLLVFDDEKGYNRAIRYSKNQRSPYVDEQDDSAQTDKVMFKDGFLHVPANDPVLQQFLELHPLNGKKFELVDKEADAQKDLSIMEQEIEALNMVRTMNIEKLERIGRVMLKGDISKMRTAELKRDLMIVARQDPAFFLNTADDPDTNFESQIIELFDNRVIAWRNKQKDVYYNMPSNKKRLVSIPNGSDPIEYLKAFFKSEEGSVVFETLLKA